MAVKAPVGLAAAGRKLWTSVTGDYVLDEHESRLLLEACRTVDLLDGLEEAVRRDGPLLSSPQGQRAHPAAVEARQQRITLARLLAALRLPDEEAAGRPGHRPAGARGVYAVRPAS
jgi:hypothetical protein